MKIGQILIELWPF